MISIRNTKSLSHVVESPNVIAFIAQTHNKITEIHMLEDPMILTQFNIRLLQKGFIEEILYHALLGQEFHILQRWCQLYSNFLFVFLCKNAARRVYYNETKSIELVIVVKKLLLIYNLISFKANKHFGIYWT